MKSEVKPLVNMNVNPCKMCMPMGSATAFYGIKKCMTILHGSQGCATYIRRHMATHYNEPVDIASSSLTEQGTVYGGSANLKKGLKNLIELYHPEVIGVMTTCLAETIGEDVPGIIDNFYEENPEYRNLPIIPCPSPGYGGSQYEGYFEALYAIALSAEMETEKNDRINVVTAPLSPADTRYLKQVFRMFGLRPVLLPDISDNLDGSHGKEYNRLPQGGTDMGEIRKMGGARMTLELSGLPHRHSVADLLLEKYGVPCRKLNLPVGLRDTDDFFHTLSELAAMPVPEEIKAERGRYLDAMIDSHKYNSAGRAVVFGEPDLVLSTVRMMCESGILPVVCAAGSACPELKPLLLPEVKKLADMYFAEDYTVVDRADFKDIEQMAETFHANIMAGNSDGRRVAEEEKLPLIRRGFPIHDHVGGQRLRMLGYEGSLEYLDEITNALIDTTETTFREQLYDTYYKGSLIDKKGPVSSAGAESDQDIIQKKTMEHPCYNCGAHKYARIHLPVAPACNVQCNYCVRKFDCPNESRPGVTSKILTPPEALERYRLVKEKMPNLTVVGIAGPGDALANWEEVSETLRLIRKYDPGVTFCLSTNGLLLPVHAKELAELGVSHVTVTLNAVDPHISGQIYKYIRFMGKNYEGDGAGAIMVSNQLAGIRMLIESHIIVKINIVTVRGINEAHIPEVVRTVKDMGCYITNIMQLIPVEGSAFEHLEPIPLKRIQEIRRECEGIMPQMYHCQHCRADAVGTLDHDQSIDLRGLVNPVQDTARDLSEIKKPAKEALRFAVASKSGMIVDTHFGHAKEFYIYDYVDGQVSFIGRRSVEQYCKGVEECGEKEDHIQKIITTLDGCNGVIAMRIGAEPKKKLNQKGIMAINTYDVIEDAVRKAASSM